MKLMLTGVTGFIGRYLAADLVAAGHQLVLPVRQASPAVAGVETRLLTDMYQPQSWLPLLEGVDVVVHLAGRAHVLKEQANPEQLFHHANVELTLLIARQAAAAGVTRFVFVSSIGVHGNSNQQPFSVDDQPKPQELYARSKLEAERQLTEFCRQTSMELVIVRPPLVYGPDAPGNFGRLLQLLQKPWPLPFGAVHNQRSFVSIYNLCSLLMLAVQHPKAAGQILLVSDGEDVSTTALFSKISTLLQSRCWLMPVPASWLRGLFDLLRMSHLSVRLLDSLTVDISHTRELLGWQPPFDLDSSLRLTIEQSGLTGVGVPKVVKENQR
jgi:nucleoside-diphosphate-sugar epimerase